MKVKTEGKVISIKRWKEIRSIEQTIWSGMIYQSLMLDAKEEKSKETEGYFGLVYSIPSDDPPDPGLSADWRDSQVYLMINEEDDEELPFENGRSVERYEIYDTETDDVHIMYRVPYKPMTLKAIKKDPEPNQI
jgi:hypothetical protein